MSAERSSQPTGGTWRVITESPNPLWRGDGTEVLSEYGRIAETHVSGLRDLDECRANARLIAAAPDLLWAAREAEAYVTIARAALAADRREAIESVLPHLRAAIAKATEPQQGTENNS